LDPGPEKTTTSTISPAKIMSPYATTAIKNLKNPFNLYLLQRIRAADKNMRTREIRASHIFHKPEDIANLLTSDQIFETRLLQSEKKKVW